MDKFNKKFTKADMLQDHTVFHNPQLTITSVHVDETKTASTSNKTKTNSKRTLSNPISDRLTKETKYSSAKATAQIENNQCTISSKLNPVISHQLKKSNVIVSGMHADTSIPSKSYSEVQANDKSKTTTAENQICHSNFKTKRTVDQRFLLYSIHPGQFSIEKVYMKPVGIYREGNMVYIRTPDDVIEITRHNLVLQINQIIKKKMEQNLYDKEFKILTQNHKILKYLTSECSYTTKNVASTHSKLRPVNHSITTNSNQSNQLNFCKLKKQKRNQPSKRTINLPNISNKKSVQIHNISNNHHTKSSLKHSMAIETHSQTSNKQIITGNQFPMSSKHPMIVPTSKNPVKLLPIVKSTIVYEPERSVKLCIKCKAVLETDVCTHCLYSSLKNVTVTRIQIPGSSAIIAPQSPTITRRPIDSSASSSSIILDCIDLCGSDENDELPCSLAPVETENMSNDGFNIEKLKKEDKDKVMNLVDNITILNDSLNGKLFNIKLCDYVLLNADRFVNDKIINYYLNYWYNYKLSDEDQYRTYIFDTFFYDELTSPIKPSEVDSALSPSEIKLKRIKRFTEKQNVDIFQKDFIFIPVHENNNWFLSIICFPHLSGKVNVRNGTPLQAPDEQPNSSYKQQRVDFINPKRLEADPNNENLWLFDSNTTQNYFEKHGLSYAEDVANLKAKKHILAKQPCIIIFDSLSGGVHRARITATLREWISYEYCTKYIGRFKDFGPKSMIGALVKVPQQPNYTECGLFLLHYFEMFFKRPIVDYSFPIYHLENWFSVDEVSTNCKKRREINQLILTRMAELKFELPPGIKLPTLDFTVPIHPCEICDDKNIVILDEKLNQPYDDKANLTECVRHTKNIEDEKEGLGHNYDNEAFYDDDDTKVEDIDEWSIN